jgi:beta-galactosidase
VTFAVAVPAVGAQPDVLVENLGRVNFGVGTLGDRNNLLATPAPDGVHHFGWGRFALRVDAPPPLPHRRRRAARARAPAVPTLYAVTFAVVDAPRDTFLRCPTGRMGEWRAAGPPSDANGRACRGGG